MAVVSLYALGTFERRVNGARHALKFWGYRLIKRRGPSDERVGMFAIVDAATCSVVAGELSSPSMTLVEVEEWFNSQGFARKLAADGTLMRDVCRSTMSEAQRDIVDRMKALSTKERLELARYFSIDLLREKLM